MTAPERRLRALAASSFASYRYDTSLRRPEPELIRAGTRGHLPFEALTTDLVRGCLPATHVCYGNCFAARAAFEAGVDFGARVPNIMDHDVLREDLAALPGSQRYLRNGWNGDPSWDWDTAVELTRLVTASSRHMVFITKYFRELNPENRAALAQLGAELRISMSVFDPPAQLTARIRGAEAYRGHGGVAVAQMMTARFADDALNRKQDALVAALVRRDFPVSENSLRFGVGSPVLDAIDLRSCGRESEDGDLWSGRLYPQLRVPTLTSVPPGYSGLRSGFGSGNDAAFLDSLWHDPVRTHDEVMTETRTAKPRQCGVPARWGGAGAPDEPLIGRFPGSPCGPDAGR
jgi:hypothetical protein